MYKISSHELRLYAAVGEENGESSERRRHGETRIDEGHDDVKIKLRSSKEVYVKGKGKDAGSWRTGGKKSEEREGEEKSKSRMSVVDGAHACSQIRHIQLECFI